MDVRGAETRHTTSTAASLVVSLDPRFGAYLVKLELTGPGEIVTVSCDMWL